VKIAIFEEIKIKIFPIIKVAFTISSIRERKCQLLYIPRFIHAQMKEYLRKELMKKRKSLSDVDISRKSSQIEERLFEMNEYKESQRILFYVSYDNEVYTHNMIKKSMSEEKNVVVPVSNKENRTLILSKLDKWENLETGSYNILEPKKGCIEKISLDRIDLIIVPGVGFDKQGHRIGHGMGYYDKLLKNSRDASHIGLAFELQLVDKIPTEKHDVPVEKIITEKRTINCKDFRSQVL